MGQIARLAIIVSPGSSVPLGAVRQPPITTMRLITGFSRFLNDFPFPDVAPLSRPAMQLEQDLLYSDELPPDAKRLLDQADHTIADVRESTKRELVKIQERAEREIEAIRTRAKAEEAKENAKASQVLSPVLRDLFSRLKELQAEHLLAGHLDEALAIRSRLRSLRGDLSGIKPDPGNLSDYPAADIGKSFLFDITGSTTDNVWGHGLYTGDSSLSTAAVHAGVLRDGERGIVRVTLVDGSENVFESIERYGISSLEYGNYTVAFTVERV